jgi:hypothetical protein
LTAFVYGFVRTSFSDSAWRHPNKFNPWWY